MALSKSGSGNLLMPVVLSVSAAFAPAVMLHGCAGKGDPAGGGNETARVCESASPGDASARGPAAAYWAVDRVEAGGAAGEAVAVLENLETLRTEERPAKDLPGGAKEGHVLTGGGFDREGTAARAARLRGRFERLKAD